MTARLVECQRGQSAAISASAASAPRWAAAMPPRVSPGPGDGGAGCCPDVGGTGAAEAGPEAGGGAEVPAGAAVPTPDSGASLGPLGSGRGVTGPGAMPPSVGGGAAADQGGTRDRSP